MLGGVGLPGDGQRDVASDLAVRVAGRAGHAALGVALETVLAAAAVRRRLAKEAALLVAGRVRAPAVAVAAQTARLFRPSTPPSPTSSAENPNKNTNKTRSQLR